MPCSVTVWGQTNFYAQWHIKAGVQASSFNSRTYYNAYTLWRLVIIKYIVIERQTNLLLL